MGILSSADIGSLMRRYRLDAGLIPLQNPESRRSPESLFLDSVNTELYPSISSDSQVSGEMTSPLPPPSSKTSGPRNGQKTLSISEGLYLSAEILWFLSRS